MIAVFDCPKCGHPNKQSVDAMSKPFHCKSDPCRETLTHNAHAQVVTCKSEGGEPEVGSQVRLTDSE
jgi:hypothetical protein